jgi:hypothetical protein
MDMRGIAAVLFVAPVLLAAQQQAKQPGIEITSHHF